jgi:phosphoribosyl-ATP pyrophosphohydrolase/phosphoribosyl-AMP cyclohydrolase
MDGLLPAIVQDEASGEVRMLGYMDRAALEQTVATGFVTFFSRSKQRLWVKGETSGNRLVLVGIERDCDGDSLLVRVRAEGPTCHLGTSSCFGEDRAPAVGFLARLESIIAQRVAVGGESYTARLLADGIKRIAQKVGEEGLETALAAVAGDSAELTSEAADLVFHLTVLLHAAGLSWQSVLAELRRRHAESSATASS